MVDDDGACSGSTDTCRSVRRGDTPCLVCTEVPGGGDGWDEALVECVSRGYELARVDDATDMAFLAMEAGAGDFGVGARTDRTDRAGRRDTAPAVSSGRRRPLRGSLVSSSLLALALAQGCAVDPSGLPPEAVAPDGGSDSIDLGASDLGARDSGPLPDMPGCVPSPEECNGSDDDCDRAIDEDVTVGMACDGDGDGCMDGRTACLGGLTRCQDREERVGIACDGTDADEVAEGRWACIGNALYCPDDCVASAEVCNRRDDNCNGIVDEGGVCSDEADSCLPLRRGDALYLICTEAPGAGDGWNEAQSECGRGGYALAQIDDEAERAWLYGEAGVGNWWVGGRTDRADAGGRQDTSSWTWRPSGAAVDSSLWAGGEPSGDGSCAHLAQGLGGALNDIPCTTSFNYICESRIVP